MPQTRLCLGVITGVHGVRGDVRIKPFTAAPDAVAAYGVLESEDARTTYEIVRARVAKGALVATIKGVTTRNQAEALKGTMLYVPRERLPEPEEDEFYHADLIGMMAVDGIGTKLGTVSSVLNFGAGDLLEIALEGSKEVILIPFTQKSVPKIDLASGNVTIIAPEEVE